jgi:hypothetical protein
MKMMKQENAVKQRAWALLLALGCLLPGWSWAQNMIRGIQTAQQAGVEVLRVEPFVGAAAQSLVREVARSLGSKACTFCGFIHGIAAMCVSCDDEIVVVLTWNDEKFRHGLWCDRAVCVIERMLNAPRLEIFSLAVQCLCPS